MTTTYRPKQGSFQIVRDEIIFRTRSGQRISLAPYTFGAWGFGAFTELVEILENAVMLARDGQTYEQVWNDAAVGLAGSTYLSQLLGTLGAQAYRVWVTDTVRLLVWRTYLEVDEIPPIEMERLLLETLSRREILS